MDILLVLGRVLFASYANVYQKRLTQQHPTLLIVLACYIVLSIICLPLLWWIPLSELSSQFWLHCFLAALLDMAGTVFLVKSLSTTDLSVFGPLNAYKVIISMLLALIFLNEVPNGQGLLGVAVIILGSVFLFSRQATQTNVHPVTQLLTNRGVQYRFLSILLFSIGTLPLKTAVVEGQALATTVFWCLFGLPLAGLAYWCFAKPQAKPSTTLKANDKDIVVLAILIWLMQYTTLLVLENTLVAYALALFQLSMILQVFLGYHLFKEQHLGRRLFACLIMIGGSLLVLNA